MGSRVTPYGLLSFIVLMLWCNPCHAITIFNDDFSGLDNWTIYSGNVSASANAMILSDSDDISTLVVLSPAPSQDPSNFFDKFLIIEKGTYRILFDYTAGISQEPVPYELGINHDFWSFSVALYNIIDSDEILFDPSLQLQSTGSSSFDGMFTNPYDNAYFIPNFSLLEQNGIIDDSHVSISNFSVTTAAEPVPEPGTILLMGAGGFALALARRFVLKVRERTN